MAMLWNTHKIVIGLILFIFILHTSLGKSDELFLRRTTTRKDLLEPSMAIWSGHFSRRSYCTSKCSQEPDCVSLLYNMADESCDLFNVIYDSDDRGDVDYYWVLENRGTRWVPESCLTLSACSGNTTDGEFWIYPTVANRRRTKIYCHNLPIEPSHFITLKYPNNFVAHGISNWKLQNTQCQPEFKPPLKQTEFTKVKILIESMEVNETDYSFTSNTGSNPIPFGTAADCNGAYPKDPCRHFGRATIDTRATGLTIDSSVEFGAFPFPRSFAGGTKAVSRSFVGDQISFTCSGWCGSCGPISGPIKFKHSMEFISAADAQALICHK